MSFSACFSRLDFIARGFEPLALYACNVWSSNSRRIAIGYTIRFLNEPSFNMEMI
jgi:hypothetical protein